MKKRIVILMMVLSMVFGSAYVVHAYTDVNYGLNNGSLWYAGYAGAYCHYYDSDNYHYAQARVKSNGTWITSYKNASPGQWAYADTGLQPNVTAHDVLFGPRG